MARNVPNDAPLWLCLDFRQLPLEVFTRGLEGEDRNRPMVVVEHRRICRLNRAARDIGIEVDNNMDTAYTLSEQVTSFERDEAREYRHLSHLAQWAYQFTPNISIKAPSSLLLDITGSLKLFKGFDALAGHIRTGLEKLGYRPVMGMNSTPLAALATAGQPLPPNTGATVEALHGLPVSRLAVDPKIIDALQQMGIGDIGSLLALPPGGLNRRFGVFFVDYLQRLTGHKPDPQKFITQKPAFFSELVFLADVTNTQGLVFPMRRLLSELCDFLNQRQLSTRQLNWKLSHRSHPAKNFSIYLANAESELTVFMTLTQLKLDQLADVEEVDGISLTVNTFSPANAASGDLFHGTRFQQKAGGMDANASQLLNLLNTRLGPGICYGLAEADDHRPERAWRSTRIVTGAKPRPGRQFEHDDEENPRPVFLLDNPRPLQTAGGHPCLGGQLELLKGPERIDFGWWDESSLSKPMARDYYIARQKHGALFWIFNHSCQDEAAPRWYLHGIFS